MNAPFRILSDRKAEPTSRGSISRASKGRQALSRIEGTGSNVQEVGFGKRELVNQLPGSSQPVMKKQPSVVAKPRPSKSKRPTKSERPLEPRYCNGCAEPDDPYSLLNEPALMPFSTLPMDIIDLTLTDVPTNIEIDLPDLNFDIDSFPSGSNLWELI